MKPTDLLLLPLLLVAACAAAAADKGPAQLELLEPAGGAGATYAHRYRPGSYFGYSVAAYADQGIPYVIVGAPLDYVSSWRDEPNGDRRIGRAYRCEHRRVSGWSCERTPSASRSSNRAEYKGMGHVEPGSRAGQWMGAAVAATSVGRDGYFSACAPRFVSKSGVGGDDAWTAIGECLVYPGLSHPYHVISPCNRSSLPAAGPGADPGQCLSGFSSSVLGFKDGRDSVLYFAAGLPGCHDSNGELYVGRFVNRNFTGGWTYRRPSGIEALLAGRSRSLYLGQAVQLAELVQQRPGDSSGRHSRRQRAPHLLASRSVWIEANWKGAVTVMDVFMAGELHVKDALGSIGDGFGYSLTTGDINGDGYGDIAVGAPYHSNSSGSRVNSGRVYIYYGSGRPDGGYSVRPEPTVLEAAEWKTGRFGHSLANVGDVDEDGLDDLAIGCPYCGPAGNGEVHVFLGRRGRPISRRPHQVLRAEDHTLDDGTVLKQFGWSVTGGVDIDGNGYPDVVVGSHSSAAITLYRTRPAVRLSVGQGDLRAPDRIDVRRCGDGSDVGDCRIRLSGSFRLACGSQVNLTGRQLDVEMRLDSDSRQAPSRKRLHWATSRNDVIIRRVKLGCNESFEFEELADIVPATARADLVTPIVAQLRLAPAWQSADWGTPQADGANSPMRPALHPASDTAADFPDMEPLRPECGPDNVCRPGLRLRLQRARLGELDDDADIDDASSGVVIYGGERGTRVRLQALVENSGEAAHEPVLRLRLPARVDVQWASESGLMADEVRCGEAAESADVGERVLACSLGRQLPGLAPGQAPVVVVAELSLGAHLESGGGANFTVHAAVSCQEAAASDEGTSSAASFDFAVFSRAELRLTGAAASRDVVIDARTEAVTPQAGRRYRLETLGAHFNHSFEFFNAGPSPLLNVEVNLTVPVETESGDTLVYLLDRIALATADRNWERLTAAPRVLEATSDRQLRGPRATSASSTGST
ncbi:hypothetical protein BOX15_Mlig015394g1 [Macrostomum lignano]|uniref:Integrin alpha second immunoglobulin-like domain-containing protein n=1 Tax=Macrostomum lignano TaxID=282301 RepID=A0A267GGD9_9PLAT|nr:hypothetical protein BOX15_Mlig015394g3 [Macrostomum lignano]PAA84497.1 hypothetical protein BOX15_Mlig015394g1 [Macrostomum lignano]